MEECHEDFLQSFLIETQTVIKPLGALFAALPGIAGSAVLGSGRIALILDIENLVRRALEMTVDEQQIPSFSETKGGTRVAS